MRILVGHPSPSAATLERWRDRPRTDEPRAAFRHDHYQREVGLAGDDAGNAFQMARERLLRYRIFPASILRPVIDTPDGLVRDGATVAFVASLPMLPLSIEAAVRVVGTWDRNTDGVTETGIEIATLAGHPERGWERFTIGFDETRRTLTLTIDAWSRPGSLIVQLGGPLGRWIQRRASNAALRAFAEGAPTRPRDPAVAGR